MCYDLLTELKHIHVDSIDLGLYGSETLLAFLPQFSHRFLARDDQEMEPLLTFGGPLDFTCVDIYSLLQPLKFFDDWLQHCRELVELVENVIQGHDGLIALSWGQHGDAQVDPLCNLVHCLSGYGGDYVIDVRGQFIPELLIKVPTTVGLALQWSRLARRNLLRRSGLWLLLLVWLERMPRAMGRLGMVGGHLQWW